MTVIVWDGKSLAADRNTGRDVIAEWQERKIFTLNGGKLFGFSGNTLLRDKFITWISNGFFQELAPILAPNESLDAILIDPAKKEVLFCSNNTEFYRVPYGHKFAMGSLGPFAEGALMMGATAEEAVFAALNTSSVSLEVKWRKITDVDVLDAREVQTIKPKKRRASSTKGEK